LTVSDVI